MGIIKRVLVALYTFSQIVLALLSAIFEPFKGFFIAISKLQNTAAVFIAAVPSWLIPLASFSIVLGVCLLILGRK